MMAPVIAQLAEKYDGKVKIGKCNIDEEDGLARMYRVMNIPNMKIFVKGEAVGNIVGAVGQEELEAELKQVIREHNRADHPETELVTLDHRLGTYPQVLAFAYQYGAGMGEAGGGPAGGTSLMQIPAKAECLDRNRLAVYTTKDAARSETAQGGAAAQPYRICGPVSGQRTRRRISPAVMR